MSMASTAPIRARFNTVGGSVMAEPKEAERKEVEKPGDGTAALLRLAASISYVGGKRPEPAPADEDDGND